VAEARGTAGGTQRAWGAYGAAKAERQIAEREAAARRTMPRYRPPQQPPAAPTITVDGADYVLAKDAARHLGITYAALWQRCLRRGFPHIHRRDGHRVRLYVPVAALPHAAAPKPRPWTEEEDEYLHEHLGRMSREAIAKRLGRSDMAVLVRMTRLGINQRDAKGWLTGGQVAAELGIHGQTITYLVRRGDLRPQPYRPQSGNRRAYLFTQEEIERWIRRRITAPRPREQWDWRAMPPGYLRNFAARVARGEEAAGD
jgi:hypothetical protein